MNCATHTDVEAVAYCRTCGKALCATCTREVQGTVYCESCLAARLNNPYVAGAAPGVVPPPPDTNEPSPGLALFLGMIPGVGAMYNGQFVKGLIHAFIFAMCIWFSDNVSGIFGIAIGAWWFYMVFDAYTTAKARKFGQPLPDPFGFNRMFAANDPHFASTVAQQGEVIGQQMENAVNNARQQWNARNASTPGAAPNANFTAANPPYGQPYTAQPFTPVPPPVAPEPVPESGIPTSAFVLIGLGVLFLLSTLDVFRFNMGRIWPLFLIGMGLWLVYKRRKTAEQ